MSQEAIHEQHHPPLRRGTLTFDDPTLEHEYHAYHVRRSQRLVQLSLLFGGFLYVFFGVLDLYLVPEAFSRLLPYRVAGSLLFLSVLGLSISRHFARWFHPALITLVVAGGFGIVQIILIAESYGGHHYYAGLILAVMFAHGLLRMRFIHASAAIAIVVLTYEALLIGLAHTPEPVILNNSFFLLSAAGLGMVSSYGIEYYMRMAFWRQRRLEEQQAILEAEDRRKTEELEAARDVQLSMLPQEIPSLSNASLAVCMQTALEVGGDYYDFIVDRNGVLTFAVGDVTGHGAPSGAVVTAAKMVFSNYAEREDIVELIQRASRSIHRMRLRKYYMSMAFGRLEGRRLELAGTGMPPAFLYRAERRAVELLPLKGLPLGALAELPVERTSTSLGSGDVLVLMTDGLIELTDRGGLMFGIERAGSLVERHAGADPQRIVAEFQSALTAWCDGRRPSDDTTIFVLKGL